MFLSMAGMEDAMIKAGNGTVKRGNGGSEDMDADIEHSKNYGKLQRAMKPGGEIRKEMEELKKKQAPFRAALEAEIKAVVEEEMKFS
jgi:hypothetical protein